MRGLMPRGRDRRQTLRADEQAHHAARRRPAQFWIEPHSFYGFAFLVDYCRERGIPVRVVGRGSNLLVRDGGIRGAVIHPTGGAFSESASARAARSPPAPACV
jgi:UDP-N-acetylmuramate--alanine ligase